MLNLEVGAGAVGGLLRICVRDGGGRNRTDRRRDKAKWQ
jgi:hypothetical protein